MIGLIKDEMQVSVCFCPIFVSRLNRYLKLSIPYEPENYGEYGIAWSFHLTRLPSVWIHWGNSTYTSFKAFIKYK